MRPSTKTTSEAAADAAERPRKVRCQTHPAEGCQGFMGTGSDQPPYFWAKFARTGKFSPRRLFLFWTVHGPFSLFLRPEKEKMGGAFPHGKAVQPPSRPRGADSKGIQNPHPLSGEHKGGSS